MPRKLIFRDLTEFRHLYWDGWPEARMARHLRVDPSVVRRIIKERGLVPHTRKSANQFLAAERSLSERKAFTKAANAARRRPR